MEYKKITVPAFFDAHCHFREEPILSQVLAHTTSYCDRATAMPNLSSHPILTAEDAVWYQALILKANKRYQKPAKFEPVMTIEIRDSTTPEMIVEAKKAGVLAGKIYPAGTTTNSEEGLRDFFSAKTKEVFSTMEQVGMLCLFHGEIDLPGVLVTERVEKFLPILFRLAGMFPNLRIGLEHISTRAEVEAVRKLRATNKIFSTVTIQHLCLTLNDVVGYGTQPHNICAPIPKTFDDRDAIIEAALSGEEEFIFGSDTAPHLVGKKECAVGANGIYSAPMAAPWLIGFFEKHNHLDLVRDFASDFGRKRYGLSRSEREITFVKRPWIVPERYGEIVPFMAGEKMDWMLQLDA